MIISIVHLKILDCFCLILTFILTEITAITFLLLKHPIFITLFSCISLYIDTMGKREGEGAFRWGTLGGEPELQIP